jgi:hypothetical protein
MPYRWGSLPHMRLPSSLFRGGVLYAKADAIKVLLVLLQRHKTQSKNDRRRGEYSCKHIPNPEAVAKVTQKDLAKATGYTLRTISSAIKSLREIGYIQVTRVRSLSRKRAADGCQYTLMNPATNEPLANTGGNVLHGNGLLYFSLPKIVLDAKRERWSMASMSSAQWKLYVSICWLAALKRAGNDFRTTRLELRKASGIQLVAFNVAFDALEEKGLIYAEASANSSHDERSFTIHLCDPRDGQPFEEDDDDLSQIGNYHVTSQKGRSTALMTNIGSSDIHAAHMEAYLRQAVPHGDPIEDRGNDELVILCPYHADHHPSCAVNVRRTIFRCFSCEKRGTLKRLVQKLTGETTGQNIERLAAATGQKAEFHHPDSAAVAVYEYLDQWGNLKKKVLRLPNDEYGCKVFSQQRYLGNGKWRYKLDRFEPMLYHAELLQQAQIVVITEGEKDADTVSRLLKDDLIVGVTSGGAGSWHSSLAKFFKPEHNIVIAPDDDATGYQYEADVAASLDEERIPYRSMTFSGTGCKDVTEFAEKHGADLLRLLIRQAWEEPKVDLPIDDVSTFGGAEICF